MTQHIQVVAKDMVVPYLASVWRDDQTLMWHLASHLEWPKDEPFPIQFMAGDEYYSDWPGTVPSPVGAPPPADQPDRRYYVAIAGKVVDAPNHQTYHYRILVVDSVTQTKHQVAVFLPERNGWYDPDVENQPQP